MKESSQDCFSAFDVCEQYCEISSKIKEQGCKIAESSRKIRKGCSVEERNALVLRMLKYIKPELNRAVNQLEKNLENIEPDVVHQAVLGILNGIENYKTGKYNSALVSLVQSKIQTQISRCLEKSRYLMPDTENNFKLPALAGRHLQTDVELFSVPQTPKQTAAFRQRHTQGVCDKKVEKKLNEDFRKEFVSELNLWFDNYGIKKRYRGIFLAGLGLNGKKYKNLEEVGRDFNCKKQHVSRILINLKNEIGAHPENLRRYMDMYFEK